MEIKNIVYNWFAGSEGDEYNLRTVGKDGVIKIEEHAPQGEGDKWFYDIHYANGNIFRAFNPNSIEYTKG